MKTIRLLTLTFVAGLLTVGCNGGDGVNLTAALSGAEAVCEGETCGGGGTAIADIEINADRTEICWEITGFAETIEGGVTGMHIHSGARGDVGPAVLEFMSGNRACAAAGVAGGATVLQDIVEDPANFYVDVHSDRFPDGAARGQLESVSS
jgi:hypothetical protein